MTHSRAGTETGTNSTNLVKEKTNEPKKKGGGRRERIINHMAQALYVISHGKV